MTQTTETKLAVMEKEQQQMASDINELKSDVKQIKDFLMGEDTKVVTQKEFQAYKTANNFVKWVIGVVTAVITTFVVLEITKVLK